MATDKSSESIRNDVTYHTYVFTSAPKNYVLNSAISLFLDFKSYSFENSMEALNNSKCF